MGALKTLIFTILVPGMLLGMFFISSSTRQKIWLIMFMVIMRISPSFRLETADVSANRGKERGHHEE